ncbi:cell wall-associated hydrolase, invasion-associated protein [Mizugakiibacter sediminis]|uniref:Hydrolase n=1 Tax=Mizugakiibacter sediminis TaxID=1475481 RepID=A0A0K8QMD8_9GAMM|nr:C40 family peptidase [Mizugakiibacter sediminis]GAP65592.1 cell wall-associated hydrolase, invasion-associated protein [Mizugakiibacter sediminis]
MAGGRIGVCACIVWLVLGAMPAGAANAADAMIVPFFPADTAVAAPAAPAAAATPAADAAADGSADVERLISAAMQQRDVRYRFGGRDPATGFDCSGFVHYVFAQALGLDLPPNSAAQFRVGERVARDAMRAGDLVFFRNARGRIVHVGIYLDDGRFIHSPSRGERVRVDRLDERYWARRFAGARRLDALAPG